MVDDFNAEWRQPLQGDFLRAEPMGPRSDWQALHRHAQDPRIYELAIGMGEPPSLDYLKQCVVDVPDITFWEAYEGDKQAGYLIYSTWSSLPRITVFLIETPWAQELWRDGINMLADRFFALESEPNMLYAHLPQPVSDDTETWIFELGFAPADQAMFIRKYERQVYGLARGVYEMFHEEIDDEAFDDDLDEEL